MFHPSGPAFSPSATTQRPAVRVEPGELCASYQVLELPGHHIARSTISGTPLSERMRTDTSVLPVRNGRLPGVISSSSTQMLKREFGFTVYCFV